jgi:predicted nucleic acid-binding protein
VTNRPKIFFDTMCVNAYFAIQHQHHGIAMAVVRNPTRYEVVISTSVFAELSVTLLESKDALNLLRSCFTCVQPTVDDGILALHLRKLVDDLDQDRSGVWVGQRNIKKPSPFDLQYLAVASHYGSAVFVTEDQGLQQLAKAATTNGLVKPGNIVSLSELPTELGLLGL